MKGIIIYKGKYGATRSYAEWLGQELGLRSVQPEACKENFDNYDFLVLGSSVYIGKLQLRHWLKKKENMLKGKKLYLFVVSGTPAGEKEKLDEYVRSSVPSGIREQCSIHFLPGRLVYKNLSRMDKFVLRMGALLNKDPQTRKAMLTDYDAVKKENLDELTKAIRKSSVKSKETVEI